MIQNTTNRVPIDQYFMNVAIQVATRSTCDRKHIGAIIVQNRQIISTGYNGSISKTEHCDDIGHLIEDGHCVRTVHAEVNAIAQAAMHGISIKDTTIYITANPCWNCFKTITNAGINKIIYNEFYRDQEILDREIKIANQIGLWLGQLQENGLIRWDKTGK